MPAVRRTQLIAELERQRDLLRRQQEQDQQVLQALYAISLACQSRPTLRAIFETVHAELGQVFSFDAFYIALCDEQPGLFRAALLIDQGEQEYIEGVEYGTLTGTLVRTREPLLFRDLLAERPPDQPRQMFGQTDKFSRAWMGVPLMLRADVVGALSLQSYQVGAYDAQHLDLLQRMANVIAVALENVALIIRQGQLSQALADQVTARTEELAALSAISASLVVRQPLAAMLDQAIGVALDLFELDAGNVRLLDEGRKHLVLHAHRGFSEAYPRITARSTLSTSPLRPVVAENRPQVHPEGWYNRLNTGQFPIEVFPQFEAAISVPLAINSTVLGTLSLFGMRPRTFSSHQISLAQAVANQIAVVVENTRLLEARERQIGELRALSSVSHAASTALTLQALLRQVHDALQGFLPLDAFSMVIYDPDRGVITDGVSIDEGESYTYWRNQPPPAHSLTAHILREQRPLRFDNLLEQIGAMPQIQIQSVGSDRMALAWLGVPLIDREGHAIGVITIQSYRPGVFGDPDEQFLRSVAAQVTLHVQNVRLLAQRERQIRELEAIGQIGKLAAASYDLTHMLDEVYRALVGLTDAAVFYLLICEPNSHMITHAVFVEEGAHVPLDVIGNVVRPGTLSDWILRNREPLLFADLDNQREELRRRGLNPQPVGPANPVRAWAGVPLMARDDELIGVLSLQDYRPFAYDSQTIEFLSQVASHISLSIQKVRLFEERERQAAENARLFSEARAHAQAAERQAHRIELVHRIASVLSARRDLQEILAIASRELVQLFWADHTGTMLVRPDGLGYLAAEYPETGIVGLTFDLRDNPIVEAVNGARRPVVIMDIETDPRAESNRAQWRALGIQSLAIVPLISRDQVFGSISLDSYNGPLIFSDDELELMMTVATSIAAAVENAQLFAAEQDQRRTADTLREMARVLSSSFDPNEVLRLVLGEIHKVVACDTASIMLLEGEQLRMVAARGRPGGVEPRGITLPLEGSAAGEVVRRGEPILRNPSRTTNEWMQIPTSADISAWLGAPLIARGKVVGVLNIDVRGSSAITFSERDVEVARTFANHAAVAIENARLYQESVTRVEQELEIARRIQANLFPRQLPSLPGLTLAARCLPARETGGDFYDLVELAGGRVGVIVGDVSGKSLPAAMLMAVARSTARSEARNHETPWVVLTETNRWLVDDVPHNSFVALSYAVIDADQRRLTLANGGQLTPLLRQSDGSTRFLDPPQNALPLGISADHTYCQTEVELGSGDTLIFYTDGIIEAHDQRRALFGFDRFERLIQRWGHLPPVDLLNRILADVHAFSEGMPTHDDMTLVVVRVD